MQSAPLPRGDEAGPYRKRGMRLFAKTLWSRQRKLCILHRELKGRLAGLGKAGARNKLGEGICRGFA